MGGNIFKRIKDIGNGILDPDAFKYVQKMWLWTFKLSLKSELRRRIKSGILTSPVDGNVIVDEMMQKLENTPDAIEGSAMMGVDRAIVSNAVSDILKSLKLTVVWR